MQPVFQCHDHEFVYLKLGQEPPHIYQGLPMARSKTRSSRKTRKPRRISFPRFSTPSFPFCTIPKTENSEMKTSECCFKRFHQTPSFSNSEFSILHCTQNGKLGDENLGVLFEAFLPNSEFSILHYTQNGKLEVGNL